MNVFIKLVKDDIITRPIGKNITIDAEGENGCSIGFILDPDAAVELARDIMTLIPGGFDGSDDFSVVYPDAAEVEVYSPPKLAGSGALMSQANAELWATEMATNGTGIVRQLYLEQFGAGGIARDMWNNAVFTLGIEYGIKIAVAKIFGKLAGQRGGQQAWRSLFAESAVGNLSVQRFTGAQIA